MSLASSKFNFGLEYEGVQILPTPRKEITQDEFVHMLVDDIYGFQRSGYDQVWLTQADKEAWKPQLETHYYWMQSKALAVTAWIHRGADGKIVHEHRYWVLGCEHKNRAYSSPRMFEHTTTCPDCGWTNTVDSSG